MLSSDRNGFSFKSSMLTSSTVCRNMQHRHNSRILPPDMKNAFLKVFKQIASEPVLTKLKIGSIHLTSLTLLTFAPSLLQATFPALYQTLCLSDSDFWLSFLQSSHCEQEIPSSIAKKITPFQQVSFQSTSLAVSHRIIEHPHLLVQDEPFSIGHSCFCLETDCCYNNRQPAILNIFIYPPDIIFIYFFLFRQLLS